MSDDSLENRFQQQSEPLGSPFKPANGRIRIGTSSFSSRDWVGPFYPPGTGERDFLTFYSSVFDTVEIDSTYYAIPSKRTVGKWVDSTPDDFIISVKFPRSIVHGGKGSKPDQNEILIGDSAKSECDRFLDSIELLGSRLGLILLQFPFFSAEIFPASEMFFDRLENFLENLPSRFHYAIEIRNRRWLDSRFVGLCRKFEAVPVMVDQAWMPHGDELPEIFQPPLGQNGYIRLLGDRKRIESITSSWDKEVIDQSDRLQRWAILLAEMAARGLSNFVYINNHYAGHAPATAKRLQRLYDDIVSGKKVDPTTESTDSR